MARNSASSSIQIPAAVKNVRTRNIAANTGFDTVMTRAAANTMIRANR